jgi:hypothetical protein
MCLLPSDYCNDSDFRLLLIQVQYFLRLQSYFPSRKQKEAELCSEISNSLNKAGNQPMAFTLSVMYIVPMQEYVG